MQIAMGKLQRGQQAKVLHIDTHNAHFATRLAAMGLVLDTKVECLMKSGKASVYRIREYVIALGHSGINGILVAVF